MSDTMHSELSAVLAEMKGVFDKKVTPILTDLRTKFEAYHKS